MAEKFHRIAFDHEQILKNQQELIGKIGKRGPGRR
jgi:hypothetical protein